MKVLHRVMTEVVKQLRDRGGVLYADAQYWVNALENSPAPGPELPPADAGADVFESRIALLEEKVEFLAERAGLAGPEDDDPYQDEDPRA